MSVLRVNIGDTIPVELLYKVNGEGKEGLDVRVSLRDVETGEYLDFADNTWKGAGWTQKWVTLNDAGGGKYKYLWASFQAVKETKIIVAEYEVLTPGYEEKVEDVFIFSVTDAIELGRWKIENNQLVYYAPDGVTELRRFILKDSVGDPTEVNVKERQPL